MHSNFTHLKRSLKVGSVIGLSKTDLERARAIAQGKSESLLESKTDPERARAIAQGELGALLDFLEQTQSWRERSHKVNRNRYWNLKQT
ncbi:hypothetical protein [Coleofasciculus sp. FACHB-SPT9]|uniref:hypothetical protein n=1 Tax=Cyanophyceae TaxID=3028117 RepID=UPI001683165C|nr:hypothetical protein [Coleofasciculus sp. FACHB-SPT9]MBD1893002.1 hypothetical protein [Coleofasciculus sp. FACHB-SPT9]